MHIELIKVGNGSKHYPGDFTLKEQQLITTHSVGRVLNLFSGISTIGEVRVDFSCQEATINMDVFDYLETAEDLAFDTVIVDAPYNQRFADKYQKVHSTPPQFIIFASVTKTNQLFSLIAEKIDPTVIIIKSWNYYIPPGFSEAHSQGYLCYAGGYRKPTLLMICRKDNA